MNLFFSFGKLLAGKGICTFFGVLNGILAAILFSLIRLVYTGSFSSTDLTWIIVGAIVICYLISLCVAGPMMKLELSSVFLPLLINVVITVTVTMIALNSISSSPYSRFGVIIGFLIGRIIGRALCKMCDIKENKNG